MNIKHALLATMILGITLLNAADSDARSAEEQRALDNSLLDNALHGRTEAVVEDIAHGANINACNTTGDTPFSLACIYRNEPVIRTLIAAGANVNAGGTFKSPLAWVIDWGNTSLVRLLIAAGADITARNCYGETALHTTINRIYLDPSSKEDALTTARILIESGANVNAINNSGNTPLHLAAHNNAIKIMLLLLLHGADSTIKNTCPKWTARDCAACWRHTKFCETMDRAIIALETINIQLAQEDAAHDAAFNLELEVTTLKDVNLEEVD